MNSLENNEIFIDTCIKNNNYLPTWYACILEKILYWVLLIFIIVRDGQNHQKIDFKNRKLVKYFRKWFSK